MKLKVWRQKIYYGLIVCIIAFSVFLVVKNMTRNNHLQVIFLDVGQGDATLIITPHGRTVLIDGGRYPGLGTSLARYMPVYDRTIDVVIATHPDADHVGGLHSVFQDYQVGTFIHSGYKEDSLLYRNLLSLVTDSDTNVVTAQAGERLVLEQQLFLDILSPYTGIAFLDKNEYSVITRLQYGENEFLFTGDASIHNEQQMIDMYGSTVLESKILKLGHHGSQTSSSQSFIQAVSPEYAVISAGCNNSFGHPHQSVLNRLFSGNIEILETCKEGDIVFESDGINITME